MKAKELMTSNPFVVAKDQPLSRAAEIMRDIDIGIVPVVDSLTSMRLLGVITDRDITVRCVAQKHGASCTVADHMTSKNLATVQPDDDVDTVISLMERDQVRRIPVVTNENRLAGVIAQADIVSKLGRTNPGKVEEVLERVSTPQQLVTAG